MVDGLHNPRFNRSVTCLIGERLGKRLRAFMLGIAFAALLVCAHFESKAFISNAEAVLRSGLWMALLIFAHNSLAATTATAGMCFYVFLAEAVPRLRDKGYFLIQRNAKLFSAAFTILIIFNSLLLGGGLQVFNVQLVHFWIPVAAVEACGMYLAILYPLTGRLSALNMAKVYSVFLIGAILETCMILAAGF